MAKGAAHAGGQQMRHVKNLMLSRPYFTRIPDQSLVVGDSRVGDDHIGATRDKNSQYAIVYSPKGEPVTVDLTKLSGPRLVGWWFNPRTGAATQIDGAFSTRAASTFTPPTKGAEEDWVLVLDDQERKFPAPGTTVKRP